MKYIFVDTKTKLEIDGHEFTLDIGEESVGDKASALINMCMESALPVAKLINDVKQALDDLLGVGASEKLLAGVSATNDIQVRHLALGIGSQINRRRAELLLTAFMPSPSTTPAI